MKVNRRNDEGVSAPDLVARRGDLATIKAEEAARLEAMKARGAVPAECGPAIPVAPARGAVRVTVPMALYPKGIESFEAKHAGHEGRAQLWVGDAFDVMAGKAKAKGKGAPFTPGQVAIGRQYRALVERHAAAGVKCSSLEGARSGGSGQGGGFIDAVLQDRQAIGAMRRRIGTGEAKAVRRIRPSERGSRSAITDRALVDAVCIEELRRALAAALDRMAGPVRGGSVVWRAEDAPDDMGGAE